MWHGFELLYDGLLALWRHGPKAVYRRWKISKISRAWAYKPAIWALEPEAKPPKPRGDEQPPVNPYDIVIPIYRQPEALARLLKTLADYPPQFARRILLADDASRDPQLEPVIAAYRATEPRAEYLIQPENLGFSGNVTAALAQSQTEVAIVLNSDTQVPAGSLDRLAAHFKQGDKIAAICPLTNNGAYATLAPPPQCLKLKPKDIFTADARLASSVPGRWQVPFASGSCWAINRPLFFHLGGFDPHFSAGYGEEADYCLRAYQQGYGSYVATNCAVWHDGSASFGKRYARQQARLNSTLLAKRYTDWPLNEISQSSGGLNREVQH